MSTFSAKQTFVKADSRSTNTKAERAQDVVIGGRFRIKERLGAGAFGQVFKGVNVNDGHPVAIKMELTKDGCRSHLRMENSIYKKFNECPVTVGIPKTYYCGCEGDYTVMVMDLLGPSLEDLFAVCNRKFSVKTVCMLGIQIIHRLQYLHTAGYLHRDIKPENFVMGLGSSSHILYVIDVGLSKAWRDSAGKHIAHTEGKALTGTARYVSINTHRGLEQSRRDDLESAFYLLCYLMRGTLPWQGLKISKKDSHFSPIRDIKIATSPDELCRGYPRQLATCIEYARSLVFEEVPDYSLCVMLLSEALAVMNETYDYCYDWIDQNRKNVVTDTRSSPRSHRASKARSSVALRGSYCTTCGTFWKQSGENDVSRSRLGSNFMEDFQDMYPFEDGL